MASYNVTPDQLPTAIRLDTERRREAGARARIAAAHRFAALMVRETKQAKKVDMGQFINSWKVEVRGVGNDRDAVVENHAPHAGVMELGARPHAVSEAGIEAIAHWAMRKLDLGVTEAIGPVQGGTKKARKAFVQKERFAKAMEVARLIARKIQKYGQPGTFMVRDNLPKASQFFEAELRRAMRGL